MTQNRDWKKGFIVYVFLVDDERKGSVGGGRVFLGGNRPVVYLPMYPEVGGWYIYPYTQK
jgi:hypothetical protein